MSTMLRSRWRKTPHSSPALHQVVSDVLAEAARVQQLCPVPETEAFRASLIMRIEDAHQRALKAGISSVQWDMAQYALCTLLDETISSTSWGEVGWASMSLLLHFHGESHGGERFFSLLEQLQQNEPHDRQVLTLFYLCLALGLEGRYRIQPNGEQQLEKIRQTLYRQLHHSDDVNAARRRGVGFPSIRQQKQNVLAGALFLSVGVAGISFFNLSAAYQRQTERLQKMHDGQKQQDWMQQVQAAIAELPDSLFQWVRDGDEMRITLSNGTFFSSGSADISVRQQRDLQRLADGFRHFPVQVSVIGHTDNVPAGKVWKSNTALSLARARTVTQAMAVLPGTGAFPVSIEGKGESVPLVPNDNADNRARNRRVEIVITPRI